MPNGMMVSVLVEVSTSSRQGETEGRLGPGKSFKVGSTDVTQMRGISRPKVQYFIFTVRGHWYPLVP